MDPDRSGRRKPQFHIFLVFVNIDGYVAKAVGLKPAPLAGRVLMRGLSLVRRARSKRHQLRTSSWFQPGRKVEDVYPTRYEFTDLGPLNTD